MEQILITCSKCHQEKFGEEFHKHHKRKSGLQKYCKECCKQTDKLYKKSIRGKEVNRKSAIKHKEQVLLRGARNRAEKKGMEFNISLTDIVIPKICPVLGIEIYRDAPKNSYNSPSLDRIDNTKGYTKDNICVISNKANVIKNIGSIDDHQRIINYMLLHGRQ